MKSFLQGIAGFLHLLCFLKKHAIISNNSYKKIVLQYGHLMPRLRTAKEINTSLINTISLHSKVSRLLNLFMGTLELQGGTLVGEALGG